MSADLAVVIPAYKGAHLSQTLDAFARQSDKGFHLYVADDASPDPIESIVERHCGDMKLSYTRFADNLGGVDLVAQWTRAVALTAGEPWLWLFSDDDLPDMDCVRMFHACVEEDRGQGWEVYRFQTRWIDAQGRTIPTPHQDHPRTEQIRDFLLRRMARRAFVCGQDHIVSRAAYRRCGFVKIDLAWGSDIASWAQMAAPRGFRTIPDVRVSFRMGANISADREGKLAERKLAADRQFYAWLRVWLPQVDSELNTDRNRAADDRVLVAASASLLVGALRSAASWRAKLTSLAVLWSPGRLRLRIAARALAFILEWAYNGWRFRRRAL